MVTVRELALDIVFKDGTEHSVLPLVHCCLCLSSVSHPLDGPAELVVGLLFWTLEMSCTGGPNFWLLEQLYCQSDQYLLELDFV